MVSVWRKLFGPKDQAVRKSTGLERMRELDAFEHEGAAAFIAGKTFDDNPYDKATQSDEWNFWVYGFSNAQGERALIDGGVYALCSTSSHIPLYTQPLEDVYRSGGWKPKYVTVPSSWGKPGKGISTEPV